MRSRILSLIYPLTRILLATRVVMLLIAPAMVAHAAGGEWQQFPDSPIANQPVTALVADRAGQVWAGTEERGVARWDGKAWTNYTIADGLPDMRIVALFEDSRARMWVATGNGLGYFAPDEGGFRRVGVTGAPALPVTAFAEDTGGVVWLGTPRGLAAWREDGAFEVADELSGARIIALARAGDGEVWAATADGMWHRSAEGWTPGNAPPAETVTRLTADQHGGLYALTEGQVWLLADGGWMALPAPFEQRVSAFAADGGRLWAAHSGRVVAAEGVITQLYSAASLPGSVTNIVVAEDGAVWFGGKAGLAAYRPDFTPPNISGVSINGAADTETVTLERNRVQTLDVGVEGSREAGAAPVIVFTHLDGVDDQPRIARGAPLDAYAGAQLAPGQHTLRVWAVDEDFNWSEERRITINVPDLTYLPFGLAVPTEAVMPLLAVFSALVAVVLIVAVTIALARRARRRKAAREAVRVRSILAIAGNPYDANGAREPNLRQEEERAVVAALTAAEGRSALLLGPQGMGKTTLLRKLADPAAGLRGAYLDLVTTREEDFFREAMNSLYAALTSRMVGERPRLSAQMREAPYGEREFGADLTRLLAFQRLGPDERLNLALLLDNASALDGYGGATRDAVRRLVVASAGRDAMLRLAFAAETSPLSLNGLSDALVVVPLPPLPAATLERLLLTPVKGAYEWEPEATAGAVALSDGQPGTLMRIAERAVLRAQGEGRIRIARADVAPLRPTS